MKVLVTIPDKLGLQCGVPQAATVPPETAIEHENTAMKAAFEAKYSRDWNDPAGDDLKVIWAAAWHACASKMAQSTSRLLTALDGMDRGCTAPGFRGHQNGYGEESAGDELQAAREDLAALVGHVAVVEVEEPEFN